jgi:hypothetical protein
MAHVLLRVSSGGRAVGCLIVIGYWGPTFSLSTCLKERIRAFLVQNSSLVFQQLLSVLFLCMDSDPLEVLEFT